MIIDFHTHMRAGQGVVEDFIQAMGHQNNPDPVLHQIGNYPLQTDSGHRIQALKGFIQYQQSGRSDQFLCDQDIAHFSG